MSGNWSLVSSWYKCPTYPAPQEPPRESLLSSCTLDPLLTGRAPGGGARESRTMSPPSLHALSPHCPHITHTWPYPESAERKSDLLFAEVHTPAAGGAAALAAPGAERTPEALHSAGRLPRTRGRLPFLKIFQERGSWSVFVFPAMATFPDTTEVLHVQTLTGNKTARSAENCPPQRSFQA